MHQCAVRHVLGKYRRHWDVDELQMLIRGKDRSLVLEIGLTVPCVEGTAQEGATDDGIVEAAFVRIHFREQGLVQVAGLGVVRQISPGVLVNLAGVLCSGDDE